MENTLTDKLFRLSITSVVSGTELDCTSLRKTWTKWYVGIRKQVEFRPCRWTVAVAAAWIEPSNVRIFSGGKDCEVGTTSHNRDPTVILASSAVLSRGCKCTFSILGLPVCWSVRHCRFSPVSSASSSKGHVTASMAILVFNIDSFLHMEVVAEFLLGMPIRDQIVPRCHNI